MDAEICSVYQGVCLNVSLEKFFQTPPLAERCSNPKCRKVLSKQAKYTLKVKGEELVFCRECARPHLPKPKSQEPAAEDDTAS